MRRARAAFATWARRHPNAELVAGGSAEAFRVLQDVARSEQSWRAVLAIGGFVSGYWLAPVDGKGTSIAMGRSCSVMTTVSPAVNVARSL